MCVSKPNKCQEVNNEVIYDYTPLGSQKKTPKQNKTNQNKRSGMYYSKTTPIKNLKSLNWNNFIKTKSTIKLAFDIWQAKKCKPKGAL